MIEIGSGSVAQVFAVSAFAAFVVTSSLADRVPYEVAKLSPAVRFQESSRPVHSVFPAEWSKRTVTVNERALFRLAVLAELDDDHDGEGAARPNPASFAAAESFVRTVPFDAPDFSIGLTRQGLATVEFRDGGDFGQVIFDGQLVDVYVAKIGNAPVGFEGEANDPNIRQRFSEAFGFTLAV